MQFKTFDTETQKGKAFLVCASDGKEEKDFIINTKADVIEFFVWLHKNTKVGFCYNLEYDISSLIKYFGQQTIIDFYVEKPIIFEHEGDKYELSGFIRKFIKISKLKRVQKTHFYLRKKERDAIYKILSAGEYKGYDKIWADEFIRRDIDIINSVLSGKKELSDVIDKKTNSNIIVDYLKDIRIKDFVLKILSELESDKLGKDELTDKFESEMDDYIEGKRKSPPAPPKKNYKSSFANSRETTLFYDICQYYNFMSLNKASKEFLGVAKDDIDSEWKKDMFTYFKNPKHKDKIIKYCRKDANLTHRLASHFLKMLVNAGVVEENKINTARYYSSGYIAKKFINREAKVLAFYDEEVNAYMKKFCFGGRIEVARRGYFDKVHLYDINSAYGSGLANLKDITRHKFTQRIDESADYFFADCDFELPDNYIQPIPVKFNNWKYPFGKGRAILDKRTFENAMQAGTITKVHRCLNIYAQEHYPFRKIVTSMYNQRSKSDAHYYIFKNLINSYIGKLNEKVRIRTYVEEEQKNDMYMWVNDWKEKERAWEDNIKNSGCHCYYKGKIDGYCRNKACLQFKTKFGKLKEPPKLYELGNNMFYTEEKLKYKTHPIYNALVVSGMRNSMYEEGLKMGDNLIGFFTDAIFSKVPMKHTSDKLGDFSEKYKGWLYLVGSGIYETAPKIFKNPDGTEEKISGTKLRGYNSDLSLIEYAQNNKPLDIMQTPSLERIGMGRAVGAMESFHSFNELIEAPKSMNVNFDSNRIWERQFKNYGESLTSNINSEPIEL